MREERATICATDLDLGLTYSFTLNRDDAERLFHITINQCLELPSIGGHATLWDDSKMVVYYKSAGGLRSVIVNGNEIEEALNDALTEPEAWILVD